MLAEAQRQAVLAAMGIDVYLLRPHAIAGKGVAGRPCPDLPALVVASSRGAGADPGMARLQAMLPLALGVAAARVGWVESDAAGVLPPPPEALAYLALGTDLARALGEQLSTRQQMSAVIAVADAPAACLANALARRALWQALKPIARRLRQVAG